MLLPAADVVNTTQSVHVALKVAPVLVEYLPAAQSVHAALPLLVLYLPATHVVHEPALGPVNPRLQVQLESAVLPLGELDPLGHARHAASSDAPVLVEYLPAVQSVHTALPDTSLYFPATHRVQLPEGPVDPAAQGGPWHVNGVVLVSLKNPELHVH